MSKSRRGIYLLPNLVTMTSLFLGFHAIIRAFAGDFDTAASIILICVVLDGIDGQVARMLHMVSRFGAEMDSLTDAVVFGVAPALIVYLWLSSSVQISGTGERIIWLVAFFYTASTVLRLARFNVQVLSTEKNIFRGLPSPAAAALVVSLIWAWQDLLIIRPDIGEATLWILLGTLVFVGMAMVSNFSYYSLKGLNLRNKVPFITTFIVAAIFTIGAIDLPRFLFFAAFIYTLSGPVIYLIRLPRRKLQNKKSHISHNDIR